MAQYRQEAMERPHDYRMRELRRLLITAGLLVALSGVGAVGYRFFEGASWSDSVFMTVITLSTVGYGEVVPLSDAGRLFTVFLITVGIILVFGLAGMWVRLIFEGEFEQAVGRRRVKRMLKTMSGHYVVCGYGRFGRRVARELMARGERLVVIDTSAEIPADITGVQRGCDRRRCPDPGWRRPCQRVVGRPSVRCGQCLRHVDCQGVQP